jgi:hypothetical protein
MVLPHDAFEVLLNEIVRAGRSLPPVEARKRVHHFGSVIHDELTASGATIPTLPGSDHCQGACRRGLR